MVPQNILINSEIHSKRNSSQFTTCIQLVSYIGFQYFQNRISINHYQGILGVLISETRNHFSNQSQMPRILVSHQYLYIFMPRILLSSQNKSYIQFLYVVWTFLCRKQATYSLVTANPAAIYLQLSHCSSPKSLSPDTTDT